MYGDLIRRERTASRLAALLSIDDPTERLLEAGEIAQALIDHEFLLLGRDSLTDLHRLALAMVRSGGGEREVAELRRRELPPWIESKVPEGFAFYAVDPELYGAAAKREAGRNIVIGIRTIGATLGAVVAEAIGADEFVTVRPVGHPFGRTLSLDDGMARLLSDRDARYFVVDEGPGLSGSSFGCVADFLEDAGVPRDHIVLLPSHERRPGPEGSARHLDRWSAVARPVGAFELPAILPDVERITGALDATPEDLGAGAWRARVPGAEDVPVWGSRERRKYLLRASGRPWLIKFAGFGRYGREKLEKACALADATPRVAGLVHGFLITEWIDGARVVDLRRDRQALLDALRIHLAAVARQPPVRGLRGSATDGEAVDVDGRMHPWGWIVAPDGRVLKCDALDHAAAHDGLGPRDFAWDLAGAAVELGLSDRELRAVAPAGRAIGNARAAYVAAQEAIFRQGARESDGLDASRLTAKANCYRNSG